MAVREVTQDQYATIGQLLREANDLSERSRQSGLSLKQKLELQRHAKARREEAMGIGR